jgi:hypothetical protein
MPTAFDNYAPNEVELARSWARLPLRIENSGLKFAVKMAHLHATHALEQFEKGNKRLTREAIERTISTLGRRL